MPERVKEVCGPILAAEDFWDPNVTGAVAFVKVPDTEKCFPE